MNYSYHRVLSRSFWFSHLVLPAAAGLLLAFIYPNTNLDAWLIQPFYDPHARLFPLENDLFLNNVMHKGLKNLMVGVSLTMLGLWIFGLKSLAFKNQNENHWAKVFNRQFLWVFVAMLVSTSTISILKDFSMHSCPWGLLAYGGTQPWLPLFGHLPAGAKMGHCFPGGHASGGFALIAFYFGFRDSLPKLANVGLIFGLGFGFAMGWAQMMRGAHFMSHNLWSFWIVWMILLMQYLLWPPLSQSKVNAYEI